MPSSETAMSVDRLKQLPPTALLTPGEVAALFRVDPKTVSRWAKQGKLPSKRTVGAHRRYLVVDVLRLLELPSEEGS